MQTKWRLNRKKTLYTGKKKENCGLGKDVYNWILESQNSDLSMTTNEIVRKAISPRPEFKDAEMKTKLLLPMASYDAVVILCM